MLGTHVSRRAHKRADPREKDLVGAGCRGFRDAEINDVRCRLAVNFGNQNIRRLQIPVDNSLLVRVLHAFADFDEEFKPLVRRHALSVAVLRDGHARHVFHDEIRLAVRRPGVKNLRDGGMIHDCKGLALRLEALDHGLVIHSALDEFQCDLPPNRSGLLGQPYLPHAAFAQSF